jgi:integrase/recombinase XerC
MSFRSETTDAPTLTEAEQRLLLKKTGETRGAEREHMIYSMALGTGLREHELVALRVRDVVQDGQIRSRIHLTIFKGSGKERPIFGNGKKPPRQVVHLPKSVRRKLAYYLKWKKRAGEGLGADAWLFVVAKASARSESGEGLSPRTLRHHFRRWQILLRFAEPYGFHALRHTALSNLYRATKDLRAVQKQARHANINTTEIYTHLTGDEIARAVENLPC